MILFLILTSFSVSIDSFLCGFSLYKKGKTFLIVFTISITVLIMCLIANLFSLFLRNYITEKTANLGGIILILVGLSNIFHKEKDNKEKENNSYSQYIATGFAVGLDGAFANISLAIMGINALYVPFLIAFFHAILIFLGILLSKSKLAKKFYKAKIFAPIILILLGCYKLIEFFL